MINEETRRKLRELNLNEMITAIDNQDNNPSFASMSFADRIQFLVDNVYQDKYDFKVKRLIKLSRFRSPGADISNIIYEGRDINRNVIADLFTCQFIKTNTDVIFQGFTGSGKTFLACALGKQACCKLNKVRYIRMPDLLMEYNEERALQRTSSRLLKKYSAFKLLILDEWLFDDLSEDEQHFIMELIERRYDCTSTIFCTQLKRESWHAKLGGGIRADAIMDRIVHNSIWVETGSLNMRASTSSLRT